MDLATAIQKPFTDIKKLLIGIVLSIVPIVNFFSIGFSLESSGLGRNKKSAKMPEWDEWGDYFIKGLFAFVIGLLYAVPGVLIILVAIGGAIFTMVGQGMMSGNMAQILPSLLAYGPIFLFGLLVLVLGSYVSSAAVLSYLEAKDFGKAFAFGKVFKKAFTGTFFAAWLVSVIGSVVLLMILGWIPYLGGPIAGFILGVFSYTLLGEAYASIR